MRRWWSWYEEVMVMSFSQASVPPRYSRLNLNLVRTRANTTIQVTNKHTLNGVHVNGNAPVSNA